MKPDWICDSCWKAWLNNTRSECDAGSDDKSVAFRIIAEVAMRSGLSPSLLMIKRRNAYIVGPRHIAMHLMLQAGLSTTAIGEVFKMNHSTVVHADQRVRTMIEVEPKVGKLIEELKARVVNDYEPMKEAK